MNEQINDSMMKALSADNRKIAGRWVGSERKSRFAPML